MTAELDVAIVGGGPAGLAAAFWLARYRRRALVLDDAEPRNDPAWAVHGYPGLQDLSPHELRHRLRQQAAGAGAELRYARVASVRGGKDAFELRTNDGESLRARRVLLAFGRRDHLPELAGLRRFYGSTVYHCPDCDGPAIAGCAVGVLGSDREAAALALYLLTWADSVVLITGGAALDDAVRATLRDHDVDIVEEAAAEALGDEGRLRAIRLASGRELPLEALFFHFGSELASDLAGRVGCELEDDGCVRIDTTLETSVPGVYAAGDVTGPPYLAISAAAGGVRAALAIHRSLLPPAFALRSR